MGQIGTKSVLDVGEIVRSWDDGGQLLTRSGRVVNPLALQPAQIDITDIAHALSHLCRFNGHCRVFYSVAEHSVRVSLALPPELAFWGLLHDATEAYLVDLPKALKSSRGLGDLYKLAEERAAAAIAQRFALRLPMPALVKEIDLRLAASELRDLMPSAGPMKPLDCEPLPQIIAPWSAEEASTRFLARYQEFQRLC